MKFFLLINVKMPTEVGILTLEVSPASRLAGDFLVSCQPAGRRPKVSCQPASGILIGNWLFSWHIDIKLSFTVLNVY